MPTPSSIPTEIEAYLRGSPHQSATPVPKGDAKRDAKEELRRRYGLAGDFVRAAQVALILGVGAKTVRALVRDGACPIAHRRFGRSLLFKLDDFVDWYCEEGARGLPSHASAAVESPSIAPRAKASADAPSRAEPAKAFRPPLGETPAQRSDRIGRDVRAAMAERRRAQAEK